MKKILAVVTAALVSACGGSSDGAVHEHEPNDTIETANQIPIGVSVVGVVAELDDFDVFKFTVPAGGATVNIQTFDQGGVDCDPTDDSVDTYVIVYDAEGTEVTRSDNSGLNWCEDFNVSLGEGTNYVEVSGLPPTPFSYTLKVNIVVL